MPQVNEFGWFFHFGSSVILLVFFYLYSFHSYNLSLNFNFFMVGLYSVNLA